MKRSNLEVLKELTNRLSAHPPPLDFRLATNELCATASFILAQDEDCVIKDIYIHKDHEIALENQKGKTVLTLYRGRVEITVKGETDQLNPGDLYCLQPNTTCHVRAIENARLVSVAVLDQGDTSDPG